MASSVCLSELSSAISWFTMPVTIITSLTLALWSAAPKRSQKGGGMRVYKIIAISAMTFYMGSISTCPLFPWEEIALVLARDAGWSLGSQLDAAPVPVLANVTKCKVNPITVRYLIHTIWLGQLRRAWPSPEFACVIWMCSFLSSRIQKMVMGDSCFGPRTLKYGVPLSSVLPPPHAI